MFTRFKWSMVLGFLAACRTLASEGPREPAPPLVPRVVATSSAPADAGVPPAPKSRFSPVARLAMSRRQAVELHALGGELLMDDGEGIFVTKGGVFAAEPAFQDRLPVFYGVTGVAGSFPDDAWLSATVATSNSGQGTIFRYDQSWKKTGKKLPERWFYAGLADYGNGRKIALAVNYMWGPFLPRPYFELVSGKPTKLPALTPAKPGGACKTRIQPDAFVGFPSGRLIVYGPLCDTEEPAIERFEPGETTGSITVLESFRGAKCSPMGMDCGRSDAFFSVGGENDVWVVQTNVVAHFDGTDWKPIELPPLTQPIVALSAAKGVVWLVAATGEKEVGELWRRAGSEPWQREVLPAVPAGADDNRGATDVVALGDVVWISADQHLSRTGYSGAVQEVGLRTTYAED